MQCATYCLGESINLDLLEKYCKEYEANTRVIRFGDALYIAFSATYQECFYFSNGTLVAWHVNKRSVKPYLALGLRFCERPLKVNQEDRFIYRYSDKVHIAPHPYFNAEILTLPEYDYELKLALSHGFSQSIKLKMFEQISENLVDAYSPLITELAKDGNISLSRRAIKQIIGKILLAKSSINLKSSYGYMPKFFWKYPNLESYYLMMERYFDIPQRVDALNQKLDTLNEVFFMLNSYLENRHSHFLEIIIIVLIAVEIIFNVLHL